MDVRDGTHSSPKYHSTGFPLITSKNLSSTGIDFSDVSLIDKEDFDEINKRSKVDVGDILFGMIGTIGNPVIVKSTGFAIKNVALIKHGGSISNFFLFQLLKSPVFTRYIHKENAGGTQKFLGLSVIRNFCFLAPTKDEQYKMAYFLSKLDKIITLHKHKIDNLKRLKRALLQKMFV
ncbi:restriction endonuclease subunit S [Limosilactobacillus allomucosae]|uniref:Restriction endonuclease subunit S n=1 Tax=Limosilactobacillus allomucosae TaxID=3142938 RepID=A0ABV0I5G4_9LACO